MHESYSRGFDQKLQKEEIFPRLIEGAIVLLLKDTKPALKSIKYTLTK
jgi:hypothetical protein